MSNKNRIWGILRVVDGDLCWLDRDGCYASLSEGTELHVSRDDAYKVARAMGGLLCCVSPQLAAGYALPSWLHAASGDLVSIMPAEALASPSER